MRRQQEQKEENRKHPTNKSQSQRSHSSSCRRKICAASAPFSSLLSVWRVNIFSGSARHRGNQLGRFQTCPPFSEAMDHAKMRGRRSVVAIKPQESNSKNVRVYIALGLFLVMLWMSLPTMAGGHLHEHDHHGHHHHHDESPSFKVCGQQMLPDVLAGDFTLSPFQYSKQANEHYEDEHLHDHHHGHHHHHHHDESPGHKVWSGNWFINFDCLFAMAFGKIFGNFSKWWNFDYSIWLSPDLHSHRDTHCCS